MTATDTSPSGYDPFAPEVLEDPYPWYAWLRDHDPVHHVEEHDIWVVSRYDDVLRTLRSPEDFSSSQGVSYERRPVPMLISMDPPEHTRLRRLVAGQFTPRAVSGWQERISTLLDDLLDAAFEQGKVDWVKAVAEPLPVTVIAEMLGVPADRHADFRRWSDATIDTTGGVLSEENERLIFEFASWCLELVAERRALPREQWGQDLVTVLFGKTSDGDELTDAELVAFIVLLLVAGNETTSNLIANATIELMGRPDQWRLVRDDPSLIPSLVEECLRWVSPVQGLYRNTTREVELAGHTLPEDVKVLVLYASANRDRRRWPDADEFRADRYPEGRDRADHVAFGGGIHLCLGAHLARLEAQLLVRKLVDRLAAMERTGEVVRGNNPSIRSVRSVPVRLHHR